MNKMTNDILRLENIAFSYHDKNKETKVLDSFSMSLEKETINVLMGSSGSGKTTLFRLISGLSYPDSGTILLHDKDVTKDIPQTRDLALLFQNPVLYPHLTVYQNVMMGLNYFGLKEEEKDIKVKKVLSLLKLTSRVNYKPRHLSGGEKEKVALAKAFVREPLLLLLDEPFHSIDPSGKKPLFDMLRQLKDEYHTTILMISHDFKEISDFADYVIILDKGRVHSKKTPIELAMNHDDVEAMLIS